MSISKIESLGNVVIKNKLTGTPDALDRTLFLFVRLRMLNQAPAGTDPAHYAATNIIIIEEVTSSIAASMMNLYGSSLKCMGKAKEVVLNIRHQSIREVDGDNNERY